MMQESSATMKASKESIIIILICGEVGFQALVEDPGN